jgi:hypothetical protein
MSEKQLFNWHRTNEKLLETIFVLSNLYRVTHKFINTEEREDLERIVAFVENLDESFVILKNSLKTLLEEAVGAESDEVDVVETENGHKM